MSPVSKPFLALALACAAVSPALASDVSDVARETRLPVAVVESTFAAIDAFYAGPFSPVHRQTSDAARDVALKAIRDHVAKLKNRVFDKPTDATVEVHTEGYSGKIDASILANVRTTRHETTTARDCVDHHVTVTVSEKVVVLTVVTGKLSTQPRQTYHTWDLGFCRTPLPGGGWSEWTPSGR